MNDSVNDSVNTRSFSRPADNISQPQSRAGIFCAQSANYFLCNSYTEVCLGAVNIPVTCYQLLHREDQKCYLQLTPPPLPPPRHSFETETRPQYVDFTALHRENKLLKRLSNICIVVSIAIFSHYSIVGFYVCFSEVC